jgi:oxygen-independent coproporphyrinogen-3 oxidase
MAGLYVHVPFCRQRCSYCDFYFVTASADFDRFVAAVTRDINLTADLFEKEVVETVYFGGGTPSRLSVQQLGRIVEVLESRFLITDGAERTIEVNPEDADTEYLRGLGAIGFNRLSIGVQSLRENDLNFMRRSHTIAEAHSVIDSARNAGFQQFSVDLIFGLPEQSIADWMEGIDFVISKRVPHLSAYGLTVEPKTLLNKWIRDGAASTPDEDIMAAMFAETMAKLRAVGYHHYEVSSYSLPGSESQHNSSYWSHENYLGFGPSAHSFWWDGPATRWSNVRNLSTYLSAEPGGTDSIDVSEILTNRQLADERVMLGLRTSDGVSRANLGTRYGFRFTAVAEERIDGLVHRHKLQDSQDVIVLTDAGLLVANEIARLLTADDALETF